MAELEKKLSTDKSLNFKDLREANRSRVKRWHPPESTPWEGSDWANAMQGEAGELADALDGLVLTVTAVAAAGKAGNVVKKLRRAETDARNDDDLPVEELKADLAKEIADVVIYLDLLAEHYGIDMAEAVISKFNAVSEKYDFPERLL